MPPEGSDPLPPPPEPDADASDLAKRRAARRRNLYEESRSIRHLLTHTPANPYCPSCVYGKGLRAPHRKGAMRARGSKPSAEGDLCTLDWLILPVKGQDSTGAGGKTVC